jgi:hypothetical protein
MEEGFIPDAVFGGYMAARWHKGKPTPASKLLGVDARAYVVGTRTMPLSAWRCPGCGLVRTYAHARKWNKVEEKARK